MSNIQHVFRYIKLYMPHIDAEIKNGNTIKCIFTEPKNRSDIRISLILLNRKYYKKYKMYFHIQAPYRGYINLYMFTENSLHNYSDRMNSGWINKIREKLQKQINGENK